MRLVASTARWASHFGNTRHFGLSASHALRERQPSGAGWLVVSRPTTTGAFHSLDKVAIHDAETALEVATSLTRAEQRLLREALEDLAARQEIARRLPSSGFSRTGCASPFHPYDEHFFFIHSKGSTPMTDAQVKALFLVNALPFIGFGFLDNMIMIIAGNYIDQELGALLCLSTMAAAGLGNLISDVAGVGLAHYVEGVFYKMGIKHPVLSAEQLGSSRARWTTNGARAFGLTIGCIVGMFPLLFFNTDGEGKAEAKAKTSQ